MTLNPQYATSVDTGRLLAPLVADLTAWVATQNGTFYFSSDPLDTLSLLSESPVGHRVILQYDSDEAHGGARPVYPTPILRTVLKIVVSMNPGLQVAKEKPVISGNAARSSLMSIIATLRSRLMSYRWNTSLVEQGALAYEQTTPYQMAEYLPFAAYEMRFYLLHTTPMPTSTVNLVVT